MVDKNYHRFNHFSGDSGSTNKKVKMEQLDELAADGDEKDRRIGELQNEVEEMRRQAERVRERMVEAQRNHDDEEGMDRIVNQPYLPHVVQMNPQDRGLFMNPLRLGLGQMDFLNVNDDRREYRVRWRNQLYNRQGDAPANPIHGAPVNPVDDAPMNPMGDASVNPMEGPLMNPTVEAALSPVDDDSMLSKLDHQMDLAPWHNLRRIQAKIDLLDQEVAKRVKQRIEDVDISLINEKIKERYASQEPINLDSLHSSHKVKVKTENGKETATKKKRKRTRFTNEVETISSDKKGKKRAIPDDDGEEEESKCDQCDKALYDILIERVREICQVIRDELKEKEVEVDIKPVTKEKHKENKGGKTDGKSNKSSKGKGKQKAVERDSSSDVEFFETEGTVSPNSSTEIECEICCNENVPLQDLTQCPDGHLFCIECARKMAETELGLQRTTFNCMSIKGCSASFQEDQIKVFLNKKSFELWKRLCTNQEIKSANIPGLESCPFCDFACILEDYHEVVFTCLNSACGQISCRECKKVDHRPKSCVDDEREATMNDSHKAEEKLSETLVRRCPKPNCNTPIVKDEGTRSCNKMTCPKCRTVMCYICRKDVSKEGYAHFHDQAFVTNGNQSTSKCPLWDDTSKRHQDEVAKVRKEIGKLAPKITAVEKEDAKSRKPRVGENRRRFPAIPFYGYQEVHDLAGLAPIPPYIAEPQPPMGMMNRIQNMLPVFPRRDREPHVAVEQMERDLALFEARGEPARQDKKEDKADNAKREVLAAYLQVPMPPRRGFHPLTENEKRRARFVEDHRLFPRQFDNLAAARPVPEDEFLLKEEKERKKVGNQEKIRQLQRAEDLAREARKIVNKLECGREGDGHLLNRAAEGLRIAIDRVAYLRLNIEYQEGEPKVVNPPNTAKCVETGIPAASAVASSSRNQLPPQAANGNVIPQQKLRRSERVHKQVQDMIRDDYWFLQLNQRGDNPVEVAKDTINREGKSRSNSIAESKNAKAGPSNTLKDVIDLTQTDNEDESDDDFHYVDFI